ncbi:MAG: diacylglycerol kinase family protein [Muribaculaceae bacterium]|nr:diacylglycerol kinase family protein [Muribaculaceae bacterium]
MNEKEQFSWRKRGKSFRYAGHGLKVLIAFEHNARIHLVAAGVALALGWLLRISSLEWCLIVICITSVLSAEAVNSAIEALADRITTDHDPFIGRAKDLAAAAVLLLATGAVVVGLIIFLPKILSLIS